MPTRLLLGLSLLMTLSACSSALKQRQEEREKLSTTTGFFCDFVNGDDFQDVDVELNLRMARRCDASKPMTMSSYKNASEVHGVLYCCSVLKKPEARPAAKVEPKASPAKPAAAPAAAVVPPAASTPAASPAPSNSPASGVGNDAILDE